MLVASDVSLHMRDADSGNVDIPSVDIVPFWHGVQHADIDRISVDNLHLGESYPFFKSRGRGDTRYHHQLDQLSAF